MPFHLTQPGTTHPRYDRQGRLVGYVRFTAQALAAHERAAAVEQASALGKPAHWASGESAGRVSDVILDLATGEVLAYELESREGLHYVPGGWKRRETAVALHLDRARPARLAASLGALAREAREFGPEDVHEFVSIETWPDPDEDDRDFPG